MRFVAGVGKTNVDLLYGAMPRVPLEGEEIYAGNFSAQLGGGTPATLITLHRLGIPVTIQTFLGKDFFSRFAREEYQKYQITPMNLYRGDRMPVNVTSAAITKHDRAFISYSDEIEINDAQRDQALDASRGAAIVLMQESFLPIYPKLKADGAILVYDSGWREDMSLEGMKQILALADWYIPNEMEATRLTKTGSPGEAACVLSQYLEHVVIKLGNRGCLIRSESRETIVRAVPDVRAVDATGAGDAFLAGFVYGLFHGAALPECVLYGNITGAACVEGYGCLSSYVGEEELLLRAGKYRSLIQVGKDL